MVIAAGPFLFCFNIPHEDFTGFENNGFFVSNISLNGRYDLLGNPLADENYQYSIIQTLATGDTDKDGYREIILGGINDSRAMKEDGFVYIYECQGGTFNKVWEAPSSLTTWNPVTVIKIDDQDYDSNQELIIGHKHGFDIWECTANSDSTYKKVEHVTSSPNYPIVELNPTNYTDNEWLEITDGYRSDIANCKSHLEGLMIQVYQNGTEIWWKYYYKPLQMWFLPQQLIPDSSYCSYDKEFDPSITCTSDGRIYVTWLVEFSNGSQQIWVSEYVSGWKTPTNLGDPLANNVLKYPCIFEYNDTSIGILLIYMDTFMFYYTIDNELSGSYDLTNYNVISFISRSKFKVQRASCVRLNDGTFVIAFSAINSKIYKPDYDIWTITLNSNFDYSSSTTIPHQATSSYNDEFFPDIDYLRSEDKSLVIIYENSGVSYEDKIGMVSSIDRGKTWGRTHTLNPIAPDLYRIEHPSEGYIEWNFPAPIALSPCVVALDDSGFMYTFIYSAPIWDIRRILGSEYPWLGFPVYGVNHDSDWTSKKLWEVTDLDVGDTDSDGRREVIAGWEDQVGVYELKSSTDGFGNMIYKQTWLSKIFENEFTGITVYDSNGNGFEDIAISTKRGDVFVYDYCDPSRGPVNLYNSETLWTNSIEIQAHPILMETYDIDGDLVDEIIMVDKSDNKEKIVVMEDNGTIIWSRSYGGGYTVAMKLADLNNDTIPEIIFSKESGIIFAVEAKNGNQLWNYSYIGADSYAIEVFDINNNGTSEVIFSHTNDITILNNLGNFSYNLDDISSSEIRSMKIGYYTNSSYPTLAIANTDERLSVVNITDGSSFYESADSMINYHHIGGSVSPIITLYDFNDDGLDEIIFGFDRLSILDVLSGEIYYNSTYYGLVGQNFFVEDFDGDGYLEILTQTHDNGIYLEDISKGVTQWHYDPNIGELWDISIGNFGGSGNYDIAVIGSDGTVVAVDGKTGLAIWFNNLTAKFKAVITLHSDFQSLDNIVAWSELGTVAAFGFSNRTKSQIPAIFEEHGIYSEFEIGEADIDEIWIEDLDLDGWDEIIVISNLTDLYVYSHRAEELWTKHFDFRIRNIKFGETDGEIGTDIFVLSDESKILTFKGSDGTNIINITKSGEFVIRDFLIGDFNNGVDGFEIVVLFENKTTHKSYLSWYKYTGEWLYDSESTLLKSGNFIEMGNFLGDSTLDVVIGGNEKKLVIFNGSDGRENKSLTISVKIGIIKRADFDGNSEEDLVFLDGNYDIRTLNMTSFDINIINIEKNDYRGYTVCDIYNNDGIDEVIINRPKQGVIAYNFNTDEVWRYNASLVLNYGDSVISADDFGNDGKNDLLFTNYNYLNIINGSTGELSWHHVGGSKLNKPKYGHFSSNLSSDPLDVIYLVGNQVKIISGTPGMESKGYPFNEEIEQSTKAQSPKEIFKYLLVPMIFIGVLIPTIYIIKKKKKLKIK